MKFTKDKNEKRPFCVVIAETTENKGDQAMETRPIILDLTVLPPRARKQILGLYEFMRREYGNAEMAINKENEESFSGFLSDPVVVEKIIFSSRGELHERR